MSTLTTLPTDNLYKFLAIFGLIITIYCSSIYINKRITFQKDIENIDKEISLAKYSIDISQKNMSALNLLYKTKFLPLIDTSIIHTSIAETDTSLYNSLNMTVIFKYLLTDESTSLSYKNFLNIYIKEREKLEETLLKNYEIGLYNDTIKKTNIRLVIITIICGIGFLFGGFLMWIGFYYWYHLYQKGYDIEVSKKNKTKIIPQRFFYNYFLKILNPFRIHWISFLFFLILACIMSYFLSF